MFKVIVFILYFLASTQANSEVMSARDCPVSYKDRVLCEKDIENRIINNFPNLVRREGGTLILSPMKGKNSDKILVDNGLKYTVIEHYPKQHISLIKVRGFEYFDSYVYHHLYGIYVQVYGNIELSGTGMYMIGFSEDLEAAFAPNTIAVFRLGNWPELMTVFNPTDFGPVRAEFVNDKTIEIETLHHRYSPSYASIRGKCILRLYNTIWQFDDPLCFMKEVAGGK